MRQIKKIIIHCSATPEHRHVTVEDIRQWHLARGWNDIGYHYVIYLDGSVHEGRPLEVVGAHASGQNADSIGICYIGGMTEDMSTPKDTRTSGQKTSLLGLIQELRTRFGDEVTIHGHNEFAAKACPSFNVQEESWPESNILDRGEAEALVRAVDWSDDTLRKLARYIAEELKNAEQD